MLQYALNKISQSMQDLRFTLGWAAAHILGKTGVKAAAQPVGELLDAPLASTLGETVMSSAGRTVGLGAVLVSAPLSALVSSAITYRTHQHHKEQLVKRFRRQVAAYLGRRNVTEAEYDRAAESVPTLKEADEQNRKQRNWSIAISVLSSAASALLMIPIAVGPEALLHHIENPLLEVLTAGMVSFAAYLPISTALHWVAHQFSGMEKETAAGRIERIRDDLDKGRNVSQEKVLGVYVHAQPELGALIAQACGKPWDQLRAQQRKEAARKIGPQIGLAKTTADLNQGYIQPEELAFAAHGLLSGVERASLPTRTHGGAMLHAGTEMLEQVMAFIRRKPEVRQAPAESAAPPPAHVVIEARSPDGAQSFRAEAFREEKPGRKLSFVQMVGSRRGAEGSLSYREHVEHTRTQSEVLL